MTKGMGHRLGWLLIILFIAACKKGEDVNPSENDPISGQVSIRDYIPVDPAYTGTLCAIQSEEFDASGLSVSSVNGKAVAVFPGLTENQHAGQVLVLQQPMIEDNEHLYRYDPQSGSPGLNFSQGTTRWDISGSITVPTANFIIPGGFPLISGISGNDPELDKQTPYEFGLIDPISNADSVRFVIYSKGSYIYANIPGVPNSHTFQPELLQHLDSGKGILMIVAFKWNEVKVNGSTFAILHQTTTSASVTIN